MLNRPSMIELEHGVALSHCKARINTLHYNIACKSGKAIVNISLVLFAARII